MDGSQCKRRSESVRMSSVIVEQVTSTHVVMVVDDNNGIEEGCSALEPETKMTEVPIPIDAKVSSSNNEQTSSPTSSSPATATSERKQQQPARQHHTMTPQQSHQMEHFMRIKQIVKNAIAAHHTFMICGRARIIRECLLSRGWCEKFQKRSTPSMSASSASSGGGIAGDPQQQQQLNVDSNPSALMAGIGSLNERQNERLLISKMLTNHTVDFLWNAGSEWTGWPSQDNKTTIFNRFNRANFTSKVGLCSNVRQMHWYYEAGIANTLFPRCYNISQSDQLHAFIDDFRLTACLSLLKWYIDKVKNEGEESVRSTNGIVPLKALDFAIGRCSDFLGSKSHEDLDQDLEKVWSHHWEQFTNWYYKLVHGHSLFIANGAPIHKYLVAAQNLVKRLKKFWPQLDMDGTMNIWILKPGNKSRGRGIILMNKLDDILAKVNPTNKATDTRFVIQKYIERPLLIYDTKFDVRQWFIVTNAQPLTLWMYRESYLRFCSQKFSLTDFHESIHLSNNAVQCKYKNSPDRDAKLPVDNMWDIATFKEYLRIQGNKDAWEKLIYPGMKEGLVGSLLASQESMDQRKNSFELYGADFMIMDDFSVWLIEINSHPDMSSSTSVTTRLCRKAMEDTIKVVIDHRENSNADTGDFELVYKQKLSSCQAYLGSALSLQGTRIPIPFGDNKRLSVNVGAPDALKKRKALQLQQQQQQQPVVQVGPVLVDIIEKLELQLDNEFYEYLKLRTTSGVSRQIPALCDGTSNKVESGTGTSCPSINTADKSCCDAETNTLSSAVKNNNSCDNNNNSNPNANEGNEKTPAQAGIKATALSSSPQESSLPGSGKLPRTHAKTHSRKKSSKHKTKAAQAKSIKQSDVPPPNTQTLLSKIEDLEKEAVNKNKSSALAKSSRVTKTSTNLVSSCQVIKRKSNENDSPTQKTTYDAKKIVPLISSAELSPLNKDEKNTKLCQIRDRSSIKTSHLLDVSDMYAIGLAVNK